MARKMLGCEIPALLPHAQHSVVSTRPCTLSLAGADLSPMMDILHPMLLTEAVVVQGTPGCQVWVVSERSRAF